MTLREAIEQLVTLGESDPGVIADKILERNKPEWVASELSALANDVIRDMATRALGMVRRRAEVALRPGDGQSSADLKVAKMWVPDVGWKRASDLTASDLRARARSYRVLAGASLRREHWCLDVADMMDSEGAVTLGAMNAPLPALPDDGVLREIEAAA